jgi:pilus assembly protein Flp/PilA
MKNLMNRFVRDESGATAIEYGLIAALMATAVIAAIGLLSPKMSTAFDTLGTKMQVQ